MTKTDNPLLPQRKRNEGKKKHSAIGEGKGSGWGVEGSESREKAEKAWMIHTARTAAAEVAVSWST